MRVIDERNELHWMPPSESHPESECYLITPEGERINFLIHQKVPYLAGESLTDLALSLVRNESLAEEFFEDLLKKPRKELEAAGLIGIADEARKCDEVLKVEMDNIDKNENENARKFCREPCTHMNPDGTRALEGEAYFLFFAGMLVVNGLIFIPIARAYQVKNYMQGDET